MATEYNCKIIFSSEFECDFIENIQKAIGNLIKTRLIDDELQVTKTTTRIALIKGIGNFFHHTKQSEERKYFPGFKVLPTKLMKKEVLAKRLLDNDCNPPDPKVVMPTLLQATKQFEAENVAACTSRYLHKIKGQKEKDPFVLNQDFSPEYLMVFKTNDGTYIIPTNHTLSDSFNQIKIFFPDGQNTDEVVKCKLMELDEPATYDAIIFLGEYYNELKKDVIFCEMINDNNFTPAANFCKTVNGEKKNDPQIQEFYPLVDADMKAAIGALSNKHVSILHLLNESFIYLGMNHHNKVKVEYIKYYNSEPQKVHISKDGKNIRQDFEKDKCFEIATVILKHLL
jgi:hypothetical protein